MLLSLRSVVKTDFLVVDILRTIVAIQYRRNGRVKIHQKHENRTFFTLKCNFLIFSFFTAREIFRKESFSASLLFSGGILKFKNWNDFSFLQSSCGVLYLKQRFLCCLSCILARTRMEHKFRCQQSTFP